VTNLTAAQFDLAYSPTHGSIGGASLAARYTNHIVRSREIAPGVRRVVLYSRSHSAVASNRITGALAFNVAPDERVGSGPIRPDGIVLAGRTGQALVPVNSVAGSVFVSSVYRDPGSGLVGLFLPGEPDQKYLIQATEDFTSWATIATNTALSEFMDLVDTDAPRYPHRFYRTALYDAAGEITSVQLQGGNNIGLRLQGLAGREYVVQASTDLKEWRSVRTNLANSGVIEFSVPLDPIYSYQFYRIRSR
jgi:hypothetical protein